jgi:hypothetical protein
MSKHISITAILVALLLLVTALFGASALTYASLYTSVRHYQAYVRGLDAQMVMVTRNRSVFLAMVNDATEYAKKSPAMAALIQQYAASFEQLGLQGKASTPATAKPPGS